MKRLSVVLGVVALVAAMSFGALAAEQVIFDTDFSNRFDTDLDVWIEDLLQGWGTSTQAWADVDFDTGQLKFGGFQPGSWDFNQLGLVLGHPMDLTDRTTVIEIDYAYVTTNEMNPAFADAIYEGEDIYGHNGFRLTVGPSTIQSAVLSGGDGSFSGLNTTISHPAKVRWTLTHVSGANFTTTVAIDGELVHEGSVNLGSLNPAEVYFYLYASSDQGGEAGINALRIVQN